MGRRSSLIILVNLLGLSLWAGPVPAQEKLKFASAAKGNPFYDLPAEAAAEKGFWKQHGLEVEYFPFRGGSDIHRAVVSGSIIMGAAGTAAIVQAASAGVPEVIVAELGYQDFFIFVRSGSTIKEPQDLKGTKIGVPGLGGLVHAYAQLVTRALGLEKEVKFIATGGRASQVAFLKTGRLDVILSSTSFVPLRLSGLVRQLLSVRDYLPKEWSSQAMFARRDLIETKPDRVKRAVKAVLESTNFILKNPSWAVDKLMSDQGVNQEAAREIYKLLEFSKDGAIEPKGIENVVAFLVEYGIIAKERRPSVESLYSSMFTP